MSHQPCLSCDRLNLRIVQMENELAAAVEGYHIESSNRMRAEREARRWKRELTGDTSPEGGKVRAVCDYHNEKWMSTFPRARGLKYGMDGKNAVAVRRALKWGYTIEELKRAIDGAFLDEKAKATPRWLAPANLFRDENWIGEYLNRIEKKNAKELWAPIDRVLLALRNRGLRWDGVYVGAQDEGRIWRHVAECPLCHRDMLVGVRLENDWASVRCIGEGCDFFRVLEALGVSPDELALRFDPAVVEALESAQGLGTEEPTREGFPASSRAPEQRMAA